MCATIAITDLFTGEYEPEEDTEASDALHIQHMLLTLIQWEAYTLGRAPPTPEPGADLTVAQEAAIAANVELARNAGSRYLVQRWSDGTYCEKIGRKREIEIQVSAQTDPTNHRLVPSGVHIHLHRVRGF